MADVQIINNLLFTQRLIPPTPNNPRFINISYGGLNRCVVRDSNNGFVLPNCTGYCWGRALETTKSTNVDLSNNQASIWFRQNKNKWDNGTGGYPYIDFVNKEVNIVGNVEKVTNTDILKMMQYFVQPGNIICYGGGFSPSTGYTYDDNGHVQTIEAIYADKEAVDKLKRDQIIGKIVAFFTLAVVSYIAIDALLPWLQQKAFDLMLKITEKSAGFIAFKEMYPNDPKSAVIAWLKYAYNGQLPTWFDASDIAAWSTIYQIVESGSIETTYIKFANNAILYGTNYLYKLGIIATALSTGKSISSILNDIDLVYVPSFKVSESFYSGKTADHDAFEVNYVNLQSESTSISPVCQGIILIPPKFNKVAEIKKGSFPWPLVQDKL